MTAERSDKLISTLYVNLAKTQSKEIEDALCVSFGIQAHQAYHPRKNRLFADMVKATQLAIIEAIIYDHLCYCVEMKRLTIERCQAIYEELDHTFTEIEKGFSLFKHFNEPIRRAFITTLEAYDGKNIAYQTPVWTVCRSTVSNVVNHCQALEAHAFLSTHFEMSFNALRHSRAVIESLTNLEYELT